MQVAIHPRKIIRIYSIWMSLFNAHESIFEFCERTLHIWKFIYIFIWNTLGTGKDWRSRLVASDVWGWGGGGSVKHTMHWFSSSLLQSNILYVRIWKILCSQIWHHLVDSSLSSSNTVAHCTHLFTHKQTRTHIHNTIKSSMLGIFPGNR